MIECLEENDPEFIGPDHWPPNSPVATVCDYHISGHLLEREYKTPIFSINQLKRKLRTEWDRLITGLPLALGILPQFRPRQHCIVETNGGRIEDRFSLAVGRQSDANYDY